MMTGKVTCQISTVECQKYCIEKIGAKTAFRIVNTDDGDIVAHVRIVVVVLCCFGLPLMLRILSMMCRRSKSTRPPELYWAVMF